MSKRKKVISVLMAVVLTVVLTFSSSPEAVFAEGTKELITVYVAAEGKNASGAAVKVDKTAVQVETGTKATTAIKAALDQSDYKDSYVISSSVWGDNLDSIGGLDTYSEGNDWYYWNFMINSQYASVGIGNYELKDNDKISLLYSYNNMDMEASCFADDVTKNPTGSAITTSVEYAKKQQQVLAEKIYETQFQNGRKVPGIEDVNALYSVVSLARAGYACQDFYEAVAAKVGKQLGEIAVNGKTVVDEKTTITEQSILKDGYAAQTYAKIALCMTALGKDATAVNGFDLIAHLADKKIYEASNSNSRENMILFAIDSKQYALPEGDGYLTRADLVNTLAGDVEKQIGVAISWKTVDSVAMAVQALAPYYQKVTTVSGGSVAGVDYEKVSKAANKGLRYIETMQSAKGVYGDGYTENNPWSLAQVMLTAGLYQADLFAESDGTDFVKNGVTLFDAAKEFVVVDEKENKVSENLMSFQPEQLLRGFNACIRVCEKQSGIFDMRTDVLETAPLQPVEKAPEETTPDTNKKPTASTKNPVKSVKAKKSKYTVKKGKKVTVIFTVKNKNTKKVTTDKVTITAKGAIRKTSQKLTKNTLKVTIKGVKKGISTLKVKIGAKTAKVKITVR